MTTPIWLPLSCEGLRCFEVESEDKDNRQEVVMAEQTEMQHRPHGGTNPTMRIPSRDNATNKKTKWLSIAYYTFSLRVM